jgi:hypothetical protein
VIASVHIADVGAGRALRTVFRKAPDTTTVPGLRQGNLAVAAELGKGLRTPPQFGRVALVAFWDDDGALDRFESDHALARLLAGGFRARLEPLRAHGTWPGLPAEIPTGRHTDHTGPSLVLTLGRLRLPRTRAFLKASGRAEASLVHAAGLVWGTALAKPPFVSTCSLWESTKALSTYAYGSSDPGHPDAIDADQRIGGFHHENAFIRFRPYDLGGRLDGRNPLSETALAGL